MLYFFTDSVYNCYIKEGMSAQADRKTSLFAGLTADTEKRLTAGGKLI